MKTTLINCALALLFAAVFMAAGALTGAIDGAITAEERVKFFNHYSETDCRRPDPETEFRIYIEWCAARDECYRSCTIEPRDREEGPGNTMQRLLNRKHT